MTGIDSTLASVLASRIDSLIDGVAAGARTAAAQTGASTQTADMGAALGKAMPVTDAPPPASAQATLSEVALTLDAISRFGGEATPAVLGEAPIWPAPPAIDAASGASGASGVRQPSAADVTAAGGPTTVATAAVATAAAPLPVAALAAALRQTVAATGLFYESHLAQWLAGTYTAAALAEEPQTRLAAQLSLDWGEPAVDASADASTDATLNGAFGGVLGGAWAAASPVAQVPPHATAAQVLASALAAQARADASAYASARQLPDLTGRDAGTDTASAGARFGSHAADGLPSAPASVAASIHPETIPLVRQQLDLLATEQFRFSGEIWPGAKLDWTIEPDRERHARQDDRDSAAEPAWRTRLTLTLPTLGTVDADLVLRGAQLIVRVQASPAGAARLATSGDAFGHRLRAAGIELAGLSIREIGGAAPDAAATQAASTAYARAAAEATDAPARKVSAQPDDTSGARPGDRAGSAVNLAGSAVEQGNATASPLDRLFDDPFDWSGA